MNSMAEKLIETFVLLALSCPIPETGLLHQPLNYAIFLRRTAT
jgi:hypothetical protein